MKTVAEWEEKWLLTPKYGLKTLIEEVRKEAYNQAIDDLVADNVVADRDRTIAKFKKL